MSSLGERRVSAPGKLVLCGEYAVVEGRAAVVTAVNRRAIATVVAATATDRLLRVRGNDPRWTVVGPEFPSSAAGDEVDRDQPLLAAVLRELVRRGLPLPSASVAVSTAAFSATTGKLGLGSSAAAAVACAAALLPHASVHELHDVARHAHRSFQGGGSGIDVAASAYGGLLVFVDGAVQEGPALPPSLDLVVAWTGVPARTQGYVDAWRALSNRAAHVDRICQATERFLEAARSASAGELLAAVHDAREAMALMGEAARIPVVSPEHRRIAEIAATIGAAAKPSGAGGGDVAVCFVERSERGELEARLETAGFSVVPLELSARGVGPDC